MDEDVQEITVLRHHNRALRKVHKQLRKAQKADQEYSDLLFQELCSSNKEAEVAMGELWARGGFNCGPRDYEFIVETCLDALAKVKPTGHSS